MKSDDEARGKYGAAPGYVLAMMLAGGGGGFVLHENSLSNAKDSITVETSKLLMDARTRDQDHQQHANERYLDLLRACDIKPKGSTP